MPDPPVSVPLAYDALPFDNSDVDKRFWVSAWNDRPLDGKFEYIRCVGVHTCGTGFQRTHAGGAAAVVRAARCSAQRRGRGREGLRPLQRRR
jgi:hypothetical protein